MTPEEIALHDGINFLTRLESRLLEFTDEVMDLRRRLENALDKE